MMMMPVPQHLDSEQINYEFPPKSHLKALAYLDQLEEEYSFFDETSFTSLSNDSSSSTSSLSFLSGYFDERQEDNSSTTTPPSHNYISSSTHLFSSLIDGNEEDLDFSHILSQQHYHQHDYHMTQEQQSAAAASAAASVNNTTTLVDDNRLSPLQLPAQAQLYHYSYHHREQSCDSTTTITKNLIVAPQSFLSMPLYKSNDECDNNRSQADLSALVHSSTCPVTQTESYIDSRLNSLDSIDLPIIISETEPILEQDDEDNDEDRDSMTSEYLYSQHSHQQSQPQVILIRINKHNKNQQQDRCPTSLTYLASDEGYDDEDQDGKLSFGQEIESASVFLPLDNEDDDYELNSSGDKAAWTHFQQQQQQWTRRIQHLEQQLHEERAMRQAFEKAMEDMTILMDQQQKVLNDRLEQEISMRQAYEHKIQQTTAQVQPLEARLEKETAARIQLEETMVHVLDQLEFLHTQHQQHITDDASQRKRMQKKVDQALDDISDLAQQQQATSTMVGTTKTNNMTRPSRTNVNHRASIVSSSSNVTLSSSSKTNKSVIKSAARPPITKTTTTTSSRPSSSTTTKSTRSKTSIVPTPLASKRSKYPGNTIKQPTTVKSGLESQKQAPSSSKRMASHR
ncbi:hypothetical protein BC941DRAFT_423146 [Chlamydoabsidia padenii]|nr:hypothetical protein BC941DRAFT_423146 [Chlamydoabsidia padenii]